MSKAEKNGSSASDPLALLVDAANAQSNSSTKSMASTAASSILAQQAYRDASERARDAQLSREQNRGFGEIGWREAVQPENLRREALERERIAIGCDSLRQEAMERALVQRNESLEQEAMEREFMHRREALENQAMERELLLRHNEALAREAMEMEFLQRRATLMGYGAREGGGSVSVQEAEYLQQLRIEAMVQQRRQENFAQLSLAHELRGGYDIRALAQAEHLRQAAVLRQAQHEQILLSSSGRAEPRADYEMSNSGERGRQDLDLEEEKNRKAKYIKQQQLASLASGQHGTSLGAAESAASVGGNQPPHVPISNSNQHTTSKAKDSRKTTTPQKGKSKLLSRDSDSKVTIVSCPARGMPPGHDASTAYFRLPDNIKHGTELVCSYYGCRNAGAQYRFCTTCRIPVSRWNFTKLHRHDEEEPASPVSAASEGSSPKAKRKQIGRGTTGSSKKEINATAVLAQLLKRGAKEVQANEVRQKGSHLKKNGMVLPCADISGEALRVAESRRDQWDALLKNRPKSEEKTVEWVQMVLAISDVDTELDGQTSESIKVVPEITGTKPKQSDVKKQPDKQGLAGYLERPAESITEGMEQAVREITAKPADPEKSAESNGEDLDKEARKTTGKLASPEGSANADGETTDKQASFNCNTEADEEGHAKKCAHMEEEDANGKEDEKIDENAASNSIVPLRCLEDRVLVDKATTSDPVTKEIDHESDDDTASSADSVDLRARKKLKTSL